MLVQVVLGEGAEVGCREFAQLALGVANHLLLHHLLVVLLLDCLLLWWFAILFLLLILLGYFSPLPFLDTRLNILRLIGLYLFYSLFTFATPPLMCWCK